MRGATKKPGCRGVVALVLYGLLVVANATAALPASGTSHGFDMYCNDSKVKLTNCSINLCDGKVLCDIAQATNPPNAPNPPNSPNSPNPPSQPNEPNAPNQPNQPQPPTQSNPPEPDEPFEVLGEIQTYISHAHADDENVKRVTTENVTVSIKLNQTSGGTEVSELVLNINGTQSTSLVTGDNVRVMVKAPAGPGRHLLSDIALGGSITPEAITVVGPPATGKDFVIDGKPVNITSVTMIVSMCNSKAPFTADYLQKQYFDRAAPGSAVTLQNYYSTCSYNKILFLPENNIIVEDIQIPCIGSFNGAPYNTANSCDSNELYGWFDTALKQVAARGIDLRKYKRRILMLPTRPRCPWSGLASVGCVSSCMTWINNSPGQVNMQTLFHELTHNIGLQHANKLLNGKSIEYADCTDPLGCGGPNPQRKGTSLTCMSAAQQWKAGWASPTADGNIDFQRNMTDGIALVRTLPATALSDKNMVRVKIQKLPPYGSTTPQDQVYVFNYRVKQPDPGFDSGLSADKDRRVYVYSFNATIQTPPRPDPSVPAFKPTVLAAIDAKKGTIPSMQLPVRTNMTWWFGELGRGLAVRFVSKTATQAVISLCRFAQTTENTATDCFDGIDNNCNGLVDNEEPSCQPFWGR